MERIDKKRTTFDCGVKAKFKQAARCTPGMMEEEAPIEELQLEYFGTIQDIIKVGFRKFHMFLIDVKWFKVVIAGTQTSVRRDKSGLVQVDSTRIWRDQTDTFVLPEHCEQVVFKEDPLEQKWWYVIEIAPRSKQMFEDVEIPQEMENEEQGQHDDGVEVEEQNIQHVDQEEDVEGYIEVDPSDATNVQALANIEEVDEDDQDMEDEPDMEDDPDMEEQLGRAAHLELQLEDETDDEIFLEIDISGARDLFEDERVDDEL